MGMCALAPDGWPTPGPQGDAGPRRRFPPRAGNEALGAWTSGTAPRIATAAWTEERECRHQNRGEGLL
uniref:Uncharacterized protein n=1 Tax=Monodon monoceros TaxID=40151 RepID=A0A8C6C191_MONMO